MRGLPSEIYDRITFYVEDLTLEDSRYAIWPSQDCNTEGRQRLSVLRLVNKGFYRSASIRLFRVMHTLLSHYPLQQDFKHWAPKRLFEVSQSQYCVTVREIKVGINKSDDSSSTTPKLFIEDLAALLPGCLCNFRNLSALSISFPDGPRPLCTELVGNIFRYVPLPSLKQLHLALPLTYDFATLLIQETKKSPTPSRLLIKSTMKQLKCLSVSVCDSSGRGGERYYHRSPPSSGSTHLNHEYASQFFQFIQLAEELEYLSISCTHVLNMDTLDATHLYKLRSLELSRVKISHTKLLLLMERNREQLGSIVLSLFELKSGTWKDVLMQLFLYPNLEVFRMGSCGYTKDGESSRLAPGLLPPIGDPKPIETHHSPDNYALVDLQQHINTNRLAKRLLEIRKYECSEAKNESL